MSDTFAELTDAITRLKYALHRIDPEVGLASIEIDGGRVAAIALRGVLAAADHSAQGYRSPLVKAIGGVAIKLKSKEPSNDMEARIT